jgi:hypothetical protein
MSKKFITRPFTLLLTHRFILINEDLNDKQHTDKLYMLDNCNTRANSFVWSPIFILHNLSESPAMHTLYNIF